MHIQLIPDNFDKDIYNQIATHPLQSWQWGEARKKMGIAIMRVGEYHKETLVNVYQVTFHQIPHTPFTIGYLPRSATPSEEVVHFLEHEGKKRNCIFIKVEPYVRKSKINGNPLGANINPPLGCILSSHPLFPNWTLLLDLTKSEDELLKNMHPKTRYNIKLAQKKGVIVKEMTNTQGFEIFAKLYFETCKRQKYFGHNTTYHKTIFETLKNTISHILVAFYEKTPLAAYEIFIFNGVLYYPYGGSSVQLRNLMMPHLLMWEAIRFGKQQEAKKFDMWGSLPPSYDVKNPWAGFTRFKEGFGGIHTELIGSFDLVINKLLYPIYNFVYKTRRKFLTLNF
ncbi:MAG TPA: peptidoglycan bridge formation glycyltransferase FemA/FemB family protein [Patescibacteria group bacterium]|nr:peptidoglycan bridge formation glycyltransferase FemA/FemB family protein [Patescibacteria group bacterium]